MASPETLDYWQLKAAFESLLDRTESERAAYLEQIQGDRPDLAKALRARLARWNELAHVDAMASSVRTADASGAPIEPETGPATTIAGYTVLGALGAGGMGQVWRVRRDDRPEQQLALKQLHAGATDPLARRRFEFERRVLERLNHPLIVPLIDAGVGPDDRPFLVTPWVDGERIDRWCTNQAAAIEEKVRLIADLAGAMRHAHAQMVVHCDLKPANVLVDRSGQLRILDFGIARLIDGSHAPSLDQSLMTLHYAAPEQVAGTSIGPGCDLYAMGVVFYELLCGQSPYPDRSHPAALTQAIATWQPIAPSKRTGLHTGPTSAAGDADLDAIVLKLLRKNPDERYASAQELIDDLRHWSTDQPVRARSEERGYLLAKSIVRYRWPLLTSLVLLVLAGWHVWRLDQQLAATAVERDRARAVVNYFVQLFRSGTPSESADGQVLAVTLLDRSVDRLADPAQPLPAQTRALLQLASGRVYADLGQLQQAEPLLASALTELRAANPAPIDELIDGYRTHAAVLYQLDQVPQSLAQSKAAIELLESISERNSERYAGMWQNAAIAHYTMGDNESGDQALERALQVLEGNQDRMPRAYILLLQNMADAALLETHIDEALGYLERAEQALPKLAPTDPDLTFAVQRAVLTVRRDAQKPIRTQLDKWLPKAIGHYGQQHLETALWHELAGTEALLAGRTESAKDHFVTSSDIASDLFQDPLHNYTMRFERNQLMVRVAARQSGDQPDPALQNELEALLTRRLALPAPDTSEVLLERTLMAWWACSADYEETKTEAFRTLYDELMADPIQESWHRQFASTWTCAPKPAET